MATEKETKFLANDFGATNEMNMRFTATDQAAGFSKINFIPGVGAIADKSLPANVSYTGDFPSFADLTDYLQRNELKIVGIRMQTNDVENFSGKLNITARKPNMQNNQSSVLQLASFRESNGGTFADTLNINETALRGGFVTKARVNVNFDGLKKGTWVNIALIVKSWDEGSAQTDL